MTFIIVIFAIFAAFFAANAIFFHCNCEYGITFVAGQIGSGKSIFAAREAVRHIKHGWRVYSTDYIKGCYKLDINDLKTKCAEKRSLLIIDEASLKMNSRDFQKTKLELIEYFKMSRHYHNKIILISQTFTDTDKQIRDLSTRVLFIRRVLNGVISLPVRVSGDITIGQDGQPTMGYSLGHFSAPLLLPRYFKYFDSFGSSSRELLPSVPWDNAPETPGGAGAIPLVKKDTLSLK